MLERETDSILRTLIGRTIGTRDGIVLREALEADIPRGAKAYLRAEVVREIENDFARTPSLRRIDRSAPGIAQLTRHFLRTLAENSYIERGQFLALLDNAVHFLENYLCRPQWTLASFAFQDSASARVSDILPRLEAVYDYAYFPTLIGKSLRHHATASIGAGEFKELLTKIDDQIVRQHNPRELALLMKPIFDFLLLADAAPDASIPVSPILVFLDDKKMKIMREYVEKICSIRATDDITLSGLRALIEDLYLGQPATGPPQEQTNAEGHSSEEGSPLPNATTPMDAQPDSSALQPGVAGQVARTDQAGKNIALSLTFAGMTEHPVVPIHPAGELPSLDGLLSGDLRERCVREIFMNDTEYFESVVTALNGFDSWDATSAYLDQLYELIGLGPERPEVAEFTDAVRRRYAAAGPAGS